MPKTYRCRVRLTGRWLVGMVVSVVFLMGLACFAQRDQPDAQPKDEKWSVHAQATSIGQAHDSFYAPYSGKNSLDPHSEAKASLTATIFLGLRVRKGLELYVNPEISGGEGFSGVLGMAGFPNGEITRVNGPTPKPYLSRAFIRQTWGSGNSEDPIAGGPNQLAGRQPVSRFTITFGKFAVTDFFDDNAYSHDPRTQFMNWSIMYNGAYDSPADTRGYTWGGVMEIEKRRWAFRMGSFLVSTYANGLPLDRHFRRNNGEVAEFDLKHSLRGDPGKVRFLAYVNHANMGTYRLALEQHPQNPDITQTRRSDKAKYGLGLNLEQALNSDVGAFLRAGWDDGKTETWEFTEIDRTLSGGLQILGRRWRRAEDVIGVAGVRNGISRDHREYLAAGGYDFNIGDGELNYSSERTLEAYYAFKLQKMITLTLDYQFAGNPAYNKDRGPVSILGLRLHWEL